MADLDKIFVGEDLYKEVNEVTEDGTKKGVAKILTEIRDKIVLGTNVVANPTLSGTEPYLVGLQVGNYKYKVSAGSSTVAWGSITGSIENQTDLKNALQGKIALLGNEQGSGEPYHFPYNIRDLAYDSASHKIKGKLDTITLDNNKTLKTYDLEVEIPEGSVNYNDLTNKPKINNVELSGNKTLSDLSLAPKSYIDEHDEGLQTNITNEANARSAADLALNTNKQDKLPEYVDGKYLKCVDDGTGVSLSWEDAASGEPDDYLKSADVSITNTLKLKNKDDSETTFTVDLSSYRKSAEQDTIDAGKQDKITDTSKLSADLISDGTTNKVLTSTDKTKYDGYETGKINVSDIINDTSHTDTNKPLSANIGKELNDRINNLTGVGRFLSLIDCSAQTVQTMPTSLPYTYKTGDYFIIKTTGGFKPKDGVASIPSGATNIEWESTAQVVNQGDIWRYDGTNWLYEPDYTAATQFSQIVGQPSDNSNLASALNAKQNELNATNKLNKNYIDFTDAENSSISSGITSTKISSYDTHIANNDIHVTADNKTTWNGKQNALSTEQLAAANSGVTSAKVGDYDAHIADVTGNPHNVTKALVGLDQVTNDAQLKASAKVTSIESTSTDDEIPSAKAVYDYHDATKEAVLTGDKLNAVNSGITSDKVSAYDGYATSKQDKLVGEGTGQNLKTINNNNLLGSGNIEIVPTITGAMTFRGVVADWSDLPTSGQVNGDYWINTTTNMARVWNSSKTGGAGWEETSPSFTMDAALSTTSTNPVQNQAIANAINTKQATLSSTQLDACNSGITSTKVSNYDYQVANAGFIKYASCSTDPDVATKVVTLDNSTLGIKNGDLLAINFASTNTVNATSAAPVKFSIGTDSYDIFNKWSDTAAATGTWSDGFGSAGRTSIYKVDVTNKRLYFSLKSWDNNTTYTNVALGQGYGTCSTATATAAKVVTLSNYALTTGGIISVKFSAAVGASATLNVNSKGAKAIYHRGAAIKAGIIRADDVATFIYNGSQYILIAVDRAPSEVGDIIYSTSLSTSALVIARYGGTTWTLLSDSQGVYQWNRTA